MSGTSGNQVKYKESGGFFRLQRAGYRRAVCIIPTVGVEARQVVWKFPTCIQMGVYGTCVTATVEGSYGEALHNSCVGSLIPSMAVLGDCVGM